ncbi:MAG TPA: MerR family transcriptional regulator [Spirochaetota bacterium]|nr:MerR family transcriptional regulator [Spirochaetota bacterium]HOR45460.1 MerR family transcriptional regulator [Spirochaetota bacterium]HPK57097.1 MerR family transcriptional regulator [Spirochaetota bacterium]
MYTIGKLAKKYSISRSAILYYDSEGLLKPDQRLSNGYRLYSEKSAEKLKTILQHRSAGLALSEIKKIVSDAGQGDIQSILLKRLNEINNEIHSLKMQQEVIIKLSKIKISDYTSENRNKSISEILKKAGIKFDNFMEWHRNFEKNSPELHSLFMKKIGLKRSEIKRIRDLSK